MFDSYSHHDPAELARTLPRAQASASIFLGRASFEAGVTRLIEAAGAAASECAVLHVAMRGDALIDSDAGRKTLGLAANILRARVKSGALAYLGDAQFAVLLQGVSGRDAVAYCRDAISVLEGIRLHWQGQVLTVESWIGGAMVEAHRDGMTLLEAAEHASQLAQQKSGRKLHMIHEQLDSAISVQEEDALPADAHTQTRDRAAQSGLSAR